MEFQIPMQPFVSREKGRIKRRKSGKLSPREGERKRGRKEIFQKEQKGFQVLFIRIINARRRQVGSLGCLGI